MEKEEQGKERKEEGEGPEHEHTPLLRVQVHLPHKGDSDTADQHGTGAEQGLATMEGRGQGHRQDKKKETGQKWGLPACSGVPEHSWPFNSGVSLRTPASAETPADHRCPHPLTLLQEGKRGPDLLRPLPDVALDPPPRAATFTAETLCFGKAPPSHAFPEATTGSPQPTALPRPLVHPSAATARGGTVNDFPSFQPECSLPSVPSDARAERGPGSGTCVQVGANDTG